MTSSGARPRAKGTVRELQALGFVCAPLETALSLACPMARMVPSSGGFGTGNLQNYII
jgi:hypothetical protein